jgi:hypothetical protein
VHVTAAGSSAQNVFCCAAELLAGDAPQLAANRFSGLEREGHGATDAIALPDWQSAVEVCAVVLLIFVVAGIAAFMRSEAPYQKAA